MILTSKAQMVLDGLDEQQRTDLERSLKALGSRARIGEDSRIDILRMDNPSPDFFVSVNGLPAADIVFKDDGTIQINTDNDFENDIETQDAINNNLRRVAEHIGMEKDEAEAAAKLMEDAPLPDNEPKAEDYYNMAQYAHDKLQYLYESQGIPIRGIAAKELNTMQKQADKEEKTAEKAAKEADKAAKRAQPRKTSAELIEERRIAKEHMADDRAQINALRDQIYEETYEMDKNCKTEQSKENKRLIINTIANIITKKTLDYIDKKENVPTIKDIVAAKLRDVTDAFKVNVEKNRNNIIAACNKGIKAGKNALTQIRDTVAKANDRFNAIGDAAYTNIVENVEKINRNYMTATYAIDKTINENMQKLHDTLEKHFEKQSEIKEAFKNLGRAFTGQVQQPIEPQYSKPQQNILAYFEEHIAERTMSMDELKKEYDMSKNAALYNIKSAQEHIRGTGMKESDTLNNLKEEIKGKSIDPKSRTNDENTKSAEQTKEPVNDEPDFTKDEQQQMKDIQNVSNEKLGMVQKDGMTLKNIAIEHQTPEICLAAVKQNGLALGYVEEQTPEICMAAVKQNGLALEHVKDQTPEICMAAVKENPEAEKYIASPELRKETAFLILKEKQEMLKQQEAQKEQKNKADTKTSRSRDDDDGMER